MSSVLITGGTGTFGRAFIRACLAGQRYERIVCYSRDEVKQAELRSDFPDPRLRCIIGDVRDVNDLRWACDGVQHVVMAAALKRIDTVAYNPEQAQKTNVQGVINTVHAAADAHVTCAVLISSDKAVDPCTAYGTTKLSAEHQTIDSNSRTYRRGLMCSAVRYGNVLGSRGSVVEKWRSQVAQGKPLTLTDRQMTRFVMTIEDAVKIVQWTLERMWGGEIVLPVLRAATLGDLAEAVAPGWPCEEVGLRPGVEKLHESLAMESEFSRMRLMGDYYVIAPENPQWTTRIWPGVLAAPFTYRSDCVERLTVDEIRWLLRGQLAVAA